MSPVDENMVIDVVDEADAAVGQITRRDVFQKHANFRVIHVLVFDSKGDLLLQRLALTRARHPGYWGSSVAGYLYAHEQYEAAAKRRVEEELGIPDAGLHTLGKIAMEDEGCLKFIEVFTTVHDGPFRYDRSHIERLEFLPITAVVSLEQLGERKFTPTFLEVLKFYLTQRQY